MMFLGECLCLGIGERCLELGLFALVFLNFFLGDVAEDFGSRKNAMFEEVAFDFVDVGFELLRWWELKMDWLCFHGDSPNIKLRFWV